MSADLSINHKKLIKHVQLTPPKHLNGLRLKKQALKFSEDPRSGLLTHTHTHTNTHTETERKREVN